MSELFTVEGLNAADTVVDRHVFDSPYDGRHMAKNYLEAYSKTRFIRPDGVNEIFERESFYNLDLWETPVKDMVTRLTRVLALKLPLDHGIDYIHAAYAAGEPNHFNPEAPVPNLETGHYFIACYAVIGSSEGHYVHVELIHNGQAQRIALIKTFGGADEAWQIARIAHDFLADEIDLKRA